MIINQGCNNKKTRKRALKKEETDLGASTEVEKKHPVFFLTLHTNF